MENQDWLDQPENRDLRVHRAHQAQVAPRDSAGNQEPGVNPARTEHPAQQDLRVSEDPRDSRAHQDPRDNQDLQDLEVNPARQDSQEETAHQVSGCTIARQF